MSTLAESLQQYSELCWQLAARCQTKRAGRVMRMLAADLRLAAERDRQARKRALAAEFETLSRLAQPAAAERGSVRPGSASKA